MVIKRSSHILIAGLLIPGFALAVGLLLGQPQGGGAIFDPVTFRFAPMKGIDFVTNPSRTPKKHQPETMVSGVAVFDYNNDGLLDLYVVNGATMPGLEKSDKTYYNHLYRNRGNFEFEDVTEKAGVQGRGYNLGVITGDYDNDGNTDFFVCGLRSNILYHNNGDGTFSDVSAKAGFNRPDPQYGTLWAVSAAFFDYDRDGFLDLFVSNYCVWDPATEPICPVNGIPDYCHPRLYKGLPNSLFHNNADGTFADVSVSSGIRKYVGKGMGLGVADFNEDGWPDVFVANDTLPGMLFINNRNGTFQEHAVESFVAYTDSGRAVSGMGVDARDIDNDGRPDIFETALVSETMPFYRNMGNLIFEERTFTSGLAGLSTPKSGWSNAILDLNNDGWKDLFVACGDVMDTDGFFSTRVPQSNAIFVNLKNGRFADGSVNAGADFQHKAIHRGSAWGDFDNDGRLDLVVSALNAPLVIFQNTSPKPNHWLNIRTIGSKSNRDGIGAKIVLISASGSQYYHINSAVGYGCASSVIAHFGLGSDSEVQSLQINWPSGTVQKLQQVKPDQLLTLNEP
jgi:enediyne biosynthesis protein E4